jgi:hypothetical protein
MKNRFLNTVPKAVQVGAFAIIAAAVLIGLAVGCYAVANGEGLRPMLVYTSAALASGVVIAIWLLCLGYVNGDARRRGMPPILWTLIVAFIPNLLGFLLYFALRRPIALPCPHCGQATTAGQRFCSWCGYQGSSAVSSQVS